uniref:Uncharacterized protein n=1 Tax=Anguilla anguilla TaxID=7936 RepID=A0A0E9RBU6_ANGAN
MSHCIDAGNWRQVHFWKHCTELA